MTGMHVREPRPCAPPLRVEHSGHKGPTSASPPSTWPDLLHLCAVVVSEACLPDKTG